MQRVVRASVTTGGRRRITSSTLRVLPSCQLGVSLVEPMWVKETASSQGIHRGAPSVEDPVRQETTRDRPRSRGIRSAGRPHDGIPAKTTFWLCSARTTSWSSADASSCVRRHHCATGCVLCPTKGLSKRSLRTRFCGRASEKRSVVRGPRPHRHRELRFLSIPARPSSATSRGLLIEGSRRPPTPAVSSRSGRRRPPLALPDTTAGVSQA